MAAKNKARIETIDSLSADIDKLKAKREKLELSELVKLEKSVTALKKKVAAANERSKKAKAAVAVARSKHKDKPTKSTKSTMEKRLANSFELIKAAQALKTELAQSSASLRIMKKELREKAAFEKRLAKFVSDDLKASKIKERERKKAEREKAKAKRMEKQAAARAKRNAAKAEKKAKEAASTPVPTAKERAATMVKEANEAAAKNAEISQKLPEKVQTLKAEPEAAPDVNIDTPASPTQH